MLTPGTSLGPYRIVGPVGAGAMGEVYRAHDSRLGRDVAIKVLPAHLADTPELRARFEREARTISQLNHPCICTLHDVGHQDGIDFLVMEFIEGETLAQRLEKGPLPLASVLSIGRQIAEALDRAHRAGVVHRDLKPGNVMLTKTGAKLMDFGLARPRGPEQAAGIVTASPSMPGPLLTASPTLAGPPLTPSPTRTGPPLTAEGSIIGTFQYMSPEQLEGREADARSDIWALGCVLYEMATGVRAFAGKSQASLIAAILKDEPRPIPELKPLTPAAFDRLVRHCLAKDPDDRWQSARDLARELGAIGDLAREAGATGTAERGGAELRGGADSGSGAGLRGGASLRGSSRTLERVIWVALIVAGAAGAYFLRDRRGDLATGGAAPTSSNTRVISAIAAPKGAIFSSRNGPMALSPDNRQLAFVAEDSTGTPRLWLRALDSAEPRALAGTDGASSPFWSPDSRSLGFFTEAKLKRIDVATGSVQVLADVQRPFGGTWSRAGFILFAPAARSRIMRVPVTGGAAAPLTDSLPPTTARQWPVLLPDERHFLFLSGGNRKGDAEAGLYVAPIDGRGPARLLVAGANNAAATPSGLIYFWRDGALWAQAFDARRAIFKGDPVRVVDHVVVDPWKACGLFSVSPGGTLVYQQGSSAQLSQIAMVDRAGREIASLTPPGSYYAPRLSHDGRRLAVDRSDLLTGQGDIWIFDVARRVGDRLTSSTENESSPVWSPDDRRLYWMSGVGARGVLDIHSQSLEGTGREETVIACDSMVVPLDCSPDGRYLLFLSRNPRAGRLSDLNLLPLAGGPPVPFAATPFDESRARISPDGHWLAYTSDESGEPEVYIQSFPQGGQKQRVSTAGGTSPVWRSDGRELFYIVHERQVMSVSFQDQPQVQIGIPAPLFRTALRENALTTEFDVTADGQRFLIDRNLSAEISPIITLDQGWTAAK